MLTWSGSVANTKVAKNGIILSVKALVQTNMIKSKILTGFAHLSAKENMKSSSSEKIYVTLKISYNIFRNK